MRGKPMRSGRYLSRDEILSIFVSASARKVIAADHAVSEATVCHIKRGRRYANITNQYKLAAPFNGSLVTMACGVEL